MKSLLGVFPAVSMDFLFPSLCRLICHISAGFRPGDCGGHRSAQVKQLIIPLGGKIDCPLSSEKTGNVELLSVWFSQRHSSSAPSSDQSPALLHVSSSKQLVFPPSEGIGGSFPFTHWPVVSLYSVECFLSGYFLYSTATETIKRHFPGLTDLSKCFTLLFHR